MGLRIWALEKRPIGTFAPVAIGTAILGAAVRTGDPLAVVGGVLVFVVGGEMSRRTLERAVSEVRRDMRL